MSPLCILVDSKEQSISAARNYFLSLENKPQIRVTHLRHAQFGEVFGKLFSELGQNDQILVCMDYISEDELPTIEKENGNNSSRPTVMVFSYECFEHIQQWCEKSGFTFERNKYDRRSYSRKAGKIIAISSDPTGKSSPDNSDSVDQKAREQEKQEKIALDRIWVQYRLMLAIISKSHSLSEVAEALIKGLPETWLDKNLAKTQTDKKLKEQKANDLKNEQKRALSYLKLNEPSMTGGTYLGEEESEQESSNVIDQLRERIKKIAATDFNVLIEGESGSGKEIVAWAIHELSNRRNKPFLALNCASFSDDLLESELYGHERGAFTGATRQRKGILQEIDGGTLFLDELPDMGPRVQAKLLRFLEAGGYRSVGADGENQEANVRIVAAGQGQRLRDSSWLRGDLKARVAQLSVELLPLRELEAKAPGILLKISKALLEGFTWTTIYQQNKTHQLTPKDIRERKNMLDDPKKRKLLESAKWQESNVRELKNFICHWLALGDGEFDRLASNNLETKEESNSNGKISSFDETKRLKNSIPLLENMKNLDDFKSLKESLRESLLEKLSETSFEDFYRNTVMDNAKLIYQRYLHIIANEIQTNDPVTHPKIENLAERLGVCKHAFGRRLKC